MDNKLKHLEFLQGVIGRMAQNSFLFKGLGNDDCCWAVCVRAIDTKHARFLNRCPPSASMTSLGR